jgi:SprT protein
MNIPTALLNDLVAKVEDKVLETYIKADAIWQRQFELPRLLFDLRGCCAGRACCRDYQIRLNPVLLLKNQTDFVEQTVFHEVGRLITRRLHRFCVKPHGREWKSVMLALGLKPIRCHTYDITNAQVRREHNFAYVCACRTIQLSARRHFKLLRGEVPCFKCSSCHTKIKFLNGGVVS